MFQKSLDDSLTVQDRLRLFLEFFGQKHISITIDEIARQLGLPTNSVYQAVHRLRGYGELDIEKEPMGESGRDKIVGIKLIKLQPSGRTYKRAAERSGKIHRIRPDVVLPQDSPVETGEVPSLPNLIKYLEKKLAVEDMKTRAIAAGLDESIIQFEDNPLAEEGIILLKLYTDLSNKFDGLKTENMQLRFDVEAEKRNVAYLKQKLRDETIQDLANMGRKNGKHQ